jgi:pimeloyl-ACP methyl ester carboxylesterase
MLLLHGGSAHAHWWDFFAVQMVDRYRVLALDLRGHGDSAWSADGEYEISTHVGDVLGIIETLGLGSLVLIGHSFGGLVAMAVAERAREDVEALVVIDTRLKVGERAARFMGALRRLPQPVYANLEEAIERFRLLPAANDAAPEVLQHVARNAVHRLEDGTWTLKFDRRGIANTKPCDLSSSLAAVRAPVLVVRAAASELMSEADLAEFRAVAPHAEAVVVPDAHHHVMLDRPEALAAAVRRFLGTANASA